MATGFVWHERYAWHDIGAGGGPFRAGGWIEPGEPHAENAATKRRMRNLLDASGLLARLTQVPPRAATVDELCRFHTPEYVRQVQALSDGEGGLIGLDAYAGRGSYEIALLSAGGTIAAVDAVLEGAVSNCYALVRPPGHHAEAAGGKGFCLFNNLVVACLHAREVRGLERIAIVDWDVHHGNGAQSAFYDDPSVLTISVHQDNVFPPDSGAAEETGAGAGVGTNINVPLPPGSGIGAYRATFERVVLPALHRFGPELVLVASGFDANAFDPLSRQLLNSTCFRDLTRMLLDATAELCAGRLVLAHEGGYSTAVVPFCGLAVLEELSGIRTDVVDPFDAPIAALGGQELQPHQEAAVDAIVALHSLER